MIARPRRVTGAARTGETKLARSDGSSGVESPPSDIPTSSSSLYNPPKIYSDFVKAIEEHAITERPDLETQLKIMQWLAGRSVSLNNCPFY
ncbi:hypothetical protein OESDEN_01455 [Oesophagostomum dentatum]|uniref:Uncharacterized protein n=1 Tax=Oesophagostomum dentatum TaxID=61180 RepID=A0A0B1TM00_OESDE|nr:hypothetical protein OESDEN_01455 [Oesophagostomum dentatum]